jgi:hypothetical protein
MQNILQMNKLKTYIDLQIESNHGGNLFCKDFFDTMKLSPLTFDVFQNSKLVESELSSLVDYTAEKVLQELCRVNQYFSFSRNDVFSLKHLYRDLYQIIRQKKNSANNVSRYHFYNLRNWLEKTNPFSNVIYQHRGTTLEAVACSEYNAALQKEILCLDKIQLLEPILDIGCGKNGSLIKSLINDNFDAHGIDRFSIDLPNFEKADWLSYNYGINKWGTIVSNLGFSNHFVHHHLRNGGNINQYAKKYLEILQSLKIGGSFCYAPDLPFVEKYLDKNKFLIKIYDIKNTRFKTTVIARLH